jgi:hypothetical protein
MDQHIVDAFSHDRREARQLFLVETTRLARILYIEGVLGGTPAKCELFVENPDLLKKPCRVRSRPSEAHFRLFLAAIEGATTEIGMENAVGPSNDPLSIFCRKSQIPVPQFLGLKDRRMSALKGRHRSALKRYGL